MTPRYNQELYICAIVSYNEIMYLMEFSILSKFIILLIFPLTVTADNLCRFGLHFSSFI
jgi:hypothetical protein